MKNFFKKNFRVFVRVAVGASVLLLLPDPVWAISGIEAGGKRIHAIVVLVGKWTIIVKGTIDCVQSVLSGDFPAAKRQFFGYLMCFAIMLSLPWGLDEIEGIFK